MVKKNIIYYLLFAIFNILLVVAAFLYYEIFSSELIEHGVDLNDIFKYPLNSHDHFVYIEYIEAISNGYSVLGVNNNYGISFIYYLLFGNFGFGREDYKIAALFINLIVIIFAGFFYFKIVDYLNLNKNWSFLFYINGGLIYFAQLINKDSFSLMILTIILYFSFKRNIKALFFIFPFALLVRIQFGIFVLIWIFILMGNLSSKRLMIVYILTSIFSAIVARYEIVMGEETLGGGFSAFVFYFNKSYLIGSLLLNPVRYLQFISAPYIGFDFLLPNGGIDLSRMKDIPHLLVLSLMIPGVIYGFFLAFRNRDHVCRVLVFFVTTFIMVWLMNPSINNRYVILITPFFVLLGSYVFSKKIKVLK